MSRMLASVVYGRSMPTGSMEKSIEYLNKAVTSILRSSPAGWSWAWSYVAVETGLRRAVFSPIGDSRYNFPTMPSINKRPNGFSKKSSSVNTLGGSRVLLKNAGPFPIVAPWQISGDVLL